MATVRITGLVRAMNHVRHQMAVGIPRHEQAAFRAEVQGYVRRVEEICRHHRATPQDLPPPSYQAYRYLKDLDLRRLPAPEAGRPPPAPPLRMRGMVATVADVQDLLDEAADQPDPVAAAHDMAELGELIRVGVEAVERAAAETGALAEHLPSPSRRAYQWLRFLAEPLNRQQHVAALVAARRLAAPLIEHPDRPAAVRQQPIVVRFYHTRSLAGSRYVDGEAQVELNEAFIVAPDDVLAAALRACILPGATEDRGTVKAFSVSEDAQEILWALELPDGTSAGDPRTRGRHFDLAAVFERVNKRCFGSALSRPRLVWSQRHTASTLGHYQPSADTVMLSTNLDDRRVPAYVIEFVMYHELLHRKLGAQVVNGRVLAHTPAFRDLERRFPEYRQAESWLKGRRH